MGVELQLVKRRRSRSTIEIYFEGKCIGIWRRESNPVCFLKKHFYSYAKFGSVTGPVIQANGRMIFEDDLRSGGLLYCNHTDLADNMVTLEEPRITRFWRKSN